MDFLTKSCYLLLSITQIHTDHIEEIAALNNISSQITWSTMVLQIAEPAQRIESMYSFLSKLSLGSKTAARWFIRDVLSPTTGALEALNAINAVLIGQVVVDPKQGSMLLQFKDALAKSGLSAAEQKKAILSYFNSLAFLQIKGIILITNAFRAIGDNSLCAVYVREIRINLYKQYVLLNGDSYTLEVHGVNHGSKRGSLLSEDSILVNNERVDTGKFDDNGNPVKNPFKGFRVTVLPIFDPNLSLRSSFFDTTTDAGQTAMAEFLNNEREYCNSSILVITSTGPAGTTCNDALKTEMKHIIGDGFTGLDNDTIYSLACIGGDLRIVTAPQTDISTSLKVKLQLDPNNPDKITFMPLTRHLLMAGNDAVWSDVLIRTGDGDSGQVPYTGAFWVSPDILNNGKDANPKPSDFESQDSYNNTGNVNGNYVNNLTNNIYVRMKNMSNAEVEVTVRLYAAPASVLNLPSKFVPIPSIRDDEDPSATVNEVTFKIAPGAIRVTPRPFLWNPMGALEHTCLIAMVGTAAHPLPDLSKVSAADIAASNHRNIAQRNISLQPAQQPVLEHIVSAVLDKYGSYQFELAYGQIPIGSTLTIQSNIRGDIFSSATNNTDRGTVGTDYTTLPADWASSLTCRALCPAGKVVPAGATLTLRLYVRDPPPVMNKVEFTSFKLRGSIKPSTRQLIGAFDIIATTA
jgi:hypothetical protein